MYKTIKRILDFIMSFIGIVVLAIPMIFIAIWIKLDSKGPVFFKQKRVGKDKKHFNILKFRSMRTDTPKEMPTHMRLNKKSIREENCFFIFPMSMIKISIIS